jgi:hypothetical protein
VEVKVLCGECVVNRTATESCAASREGRREALTRDSVRAYAGVTTFLFASLSRA